ncbi:hypothetical protein ABBQ38_008236 [Trebouxia sp. C0009 RCD-2024]
MLSDSMKKAIPVVVGSLVVAGVAGGVTCWTAADQNHRHDTAPSTPHRAPVISVMLVVSLLGILLSGLGGKKQGVSSQTLRQAKVADQAAAVEGGQAQETKLLKESAQRSKAACETAECALKTVQEQLHQAEKELESYRAAQATCTAALPPLADNAKLLPWSPAMAPLFIDPSKLNRGSLLGVSSIGAQTYVGTYAWTDRSQPTHRPVQSAITYAAFMESPASMGLLAWS